MQELKWTQERPTVPGYYWARTESSEPEPVEVYRSAWAGRPLFFVALGVDGRLRLSDTEFTLWYGPISPPKMTE
jgi:hypothetical protein